MITFALIDKYAISRAGISLFFKTQFEALSVLESESISALKTDYSGQEPELIFLSISHSSEMQNIGQIRAARSCYPSARIIFYDQVQQQGSFGSLLEKVPGLSSRVLNYLREGVNGYLTKMNSPAELIRCVQDVLENKRYICIEVYEMLIYDDANHAASLAKINNLSSREYEIASYLLEGLSTNNIALKIGRKATTISTIKNNIFKKLNVDNIIKLQRVFHPVSAVSVS